MKRIKAIRRRNLVLLNVVFVASLLLFYETHTNFLFRDFAEKRIEEVFPEGMRVEIGNIEGGVFRNLSSEDVRIYSQDDSQEIAIERMEIDYRIWDSLIRRIPAFSDFRENRRAFLFIGKEGFDFLSGFLECEGTQKKLNVSGYLSINKSGKFFVNGTLEEGRSANFCITRKKGYMDIEVAKAGDKIAIKGKVNHLELGGMDIVGEYQANVKGLGGERVTYDISIKDLILNYMVFDKEIKLSFSYDYSKETINIARFSVGDDVEGYGSIRLPDPHFIFLKWAIIDMQLSEYFMGKGPAENIRGVMNGSFVLKGPLKEAIFSAHLDVQNGNIGDTKFDFIIGNLKGKGPLVSIYDSRIRKEGGYIILEGEIDFSKFKEGKAFDNIILGPDKDFFVWEGWSVKKDSQDFSINAEKYIDDDIHVSYRTYSKERDSDQEEHFLGVEHKVKF